MGLSRRLCQVLLAAGLWPALAAGQAQMPRALRIEFDPLNHDHVAVAAASFGEFLSDDGGKHWVMSCYDAQGQTGTGLFAPSIEFTSGGTLLSLPTPVVYTNEGSVLSVLATSLKRLGADACTFDDASEQRAVFGLHRAGDGSFYTVSSALSGSGPMRDNQLLRAGADGRVFQRVGSSFESSLDLGPVVSAPSKTDTLFIGGRDASSREFRTLQSPNGGQSWQVALFEPADNPKQTRELIGVDPKDPSIVFARVGHFYSGLADPAESLWFSQNGGSTWKSLIEGHGSMRGFAYSPDGTKLLIGGSQEGLLRVDVSSLRGGNAPVVTRVSSNAVWGLKWDETGLYAGGDEYAGDPRARYTVGVSHDEGVTFTRFMSICDVVPPECGASEAGKDAARCFTSRNYWTQMLVLCHADGGAPPDGSGGVSASGGSTGSGGTSAAGGGTDAGTDTPDSSGGTEPRGDGALRITSCSSKPWTSNSAAPAFACAAAFLVVVSRRRARHR
jgi:hypothetical protein